MNILMNASVSTPGSVLYRELDGEAVILDLDNEKYFGLDDVGVRMWTQLTTQPTLQDAYNRLLSEYEVTPERLQTDLMRFVEELVAARLLELNND